MTLLKTRGCISKYPNIETERTNYIAETFNYLNGRHGDRYMKIPSLVNSFHHGDAMRTLDILSWILSSCYKYCRDYVACMGIKTTKSTSNSGSSEILKHVEFYKGSYIGFQHLLHHIFLY